MRREMRVGAGEEQCAVEAALKKWAQRYYDWLFASALPIWAKCGFDDQGWGFHENLDQDGRPTGAPRRARVQARQVYVFAKAGQLEWNGPWRSCVDRGLEDFVSHYRRSDNLYRALVSAEGAPIENEPRLYDQAFALLALSAAAPFREGAEAEALELLAAVEERFRHPLGGFRETGDAPFQSNPHMHLFEACIAWSETSLNQEWAGLANEIANLALENFADPKLGFIREYFDSSWGPARGQTGRRVEPGHQFEWAWLLQRWARTSGASDLTAAARSLYAAGCRGVDRRRWLVVDEMDDALSIRTRWARLWPQTEWLKAALRFARSDFREGAEYAGDAEKAAAALSAYLTTQVQGLWRDRYSPNDHFVEEPAPASSLYHLLEAILQLREATEGTPVKLHPFREGRPLPRRCDPG